MKLTRIAAVSAVMLLAPVMFTACITGDEETGKPDTPAAQEKPGKEEPAEAVEVKTEAKAEKPAEPAPAAQPAAEEAQPAPVLVPEQNEKAEEKKEAAPAPAPAPAAKEEKKPALPCDHVVRTGDNLWSLARKYYGTGAKWKLIFDANKENIKNENFLEPGKVLKIPAAK